jgi:hypothetical protein
LDETGLGHRGYHELGYSAMRLYNVFVVAEIDEQYFHLAAIIRINRPGRIGDGDTVLESQP